MDNKVELDIPKLALAREACYNMAEAPETSDEQARECEQVAQYLNQLISIADQQSKLN